MHEQINGFMNKLIDYQLGQVINQLIDKEKEKYQQNRQTKYKEIDIQIEKM